MRRLEFGITRRGFLALLGLQTGLISTKALADSAPKTHHITIKRFKFQPEVLEVKIGETIEWVNEDLAPHTATDVDNAWDTGDLARNETAQVRFDQVGQYDYFCAYHPHMKAVVNVVA